MKKWTKMLKLFIERSISSDTTIKIGSVQKKFRHRASLKMKKGKVFGGKIVP